MTEHDQKIVWKKKKHWGIWTKHVPNWDRRCRSFLPQVSIVWVANSKEIHSCGNTGYLEVWSEDTWIYKGIYISSRNRGHISYYVSPYSLVSLASILQKSLKQPECVNQSGSVSTLRVPRNSLSNIFLNSNVNHVQRILAKPHPSDTIKFHRAIWTPKVHSRQVSHKMIQTHGWWRMYIATTEILLMEEILLTSWGW